MKKQICVIWIFGFHGIHKSRWYLDVAGDAETRFETSNYELDRPLPKRKIKKVNGLMEIN